MLDRESTTDETKELGRRLRQARAARGWTLRQAAAETGVSNGYLSLIEHGAVKAPSPRYLMALAERYGLAYDELMALAGHPSGSVPTSAGARTATETRLTPGTGEASGGANDVLGRGWSRAGLTSVFGAVGRLAERDAAREKGDDLAERTGVGDDATEAQAGPSGDGPVGSPLGNELSDDERHQLMALVIDDMRGLTPSDIANVRAFIAGIRATRRR
jgi:DNA-binding XRE family transcriptional regulator